MTTYEKIESEYGVSIKRISDDGIISFIPPDPANSDYQAYLNKDKAEQSTPIPTE